MTNERRMKTETVWGNCRTHTDGVEWCNPVGKVEVKGEPIKGIEVPILGEITPPPPFGFESYGDFFLVAFIFIFILPGVLRFNLLAILFSGK